LDGWCWSDCNRSIEGRLFETALELESEKGIRMTVRQETLLDWNDATLEETLLPLLLSRLDGSIDDISINFSFNDVGLELRGLMRILMYQAYSVHLRVA
jgi:hypothetical protein